MSSRVLFEPPQLRLQTLSSSGSEAADLTDSADGLSWSNVNPGGDERCTFNLKREWFSGAPEIGQGKLVRVLDGVDVLWMGRIDENDRAVADSEQIGVTAYGLGVRLKDNEDFRQVFVDRSVSGWADAPLAEKIRVKTAGADINGAMTFGQDRGLAVSIPNQAFPAAAQRAVAWYIAPFGVTVSKVMYVGSTLNLPAGWSHLLSFSSTDSLTAPSNVTPTLDATLRTATPTPQGRHIGVILASAATALTPAAGAAVSYDKIAVYGDHGLTTRSISATEPDGVYGSDAVTYIVAQASGITARRIDASSYVIAQLVCDGVTLEQAIVEASQWENPGVDWGVWGTDSVLDTSLNGQFDWKAKDLTTQHWYALRSECDDIALNIELATLYNVVDVRYRDANGVTSIEQRTATVPALDAQSITRRKNLDGGTLTQAGAQQLGDAFLAISAQRPPARGQVALSQPVRHYLRGDLWPHRMRADGANLRLPDVLPSEDALALSASPDRRTTFPIKRVSVDCSGPVPKISVEVDQANDTLAILQARLQLTAQAALGS